MIHSKPVHSSIIKFIQFIHSFVHSFIHSKPVHSFIHSFKTRSFIHSIHSKPVHSFIQNPFIHSIHSFTHPLSTYQFVPPCTSPHAPSLHPNRDASRAAPREFAAWPPRTRTLPPATPPRSTSQTPITPTFAWSDTRTATCRNSAACTALPSSAGSDSLCSAPVRRSTTAREFRPSTTGTQCAGSAGTSVAATSRTVPPEMGTERSAAAGSDWVTPSAVSSGSETPSRETPTSREMSWRPSVRRRRRRSEAKTALRMAFWQSPPLAKAKAGVRETNSLEASRASVQQMARFCELRATNWISLDARW